jgi:hypothetical protein
MLPVDAFAPMVGLASRSGAYQQLARLRSRGLAEVRREDLGFVVGVHRRGLWSITELGSRVLRDATPLDKRDRPDKEVRPRKRLLKRHLPLRIACYRLLAWFLVEERAQGNVLAMRGWEWSWGSEFRLTEHGSAVRVRLPAAAHVSPPDGTHQTLSSSRRVVLLADLGTAPVARYGELLRRVMAQNEPVIAQMAGCDALLVGTPDPDGRGTRLDAWRGRLERVARREQASAPATRVVSWARVSAWLGSSRPPATGAGDQARVRPTTVAQSGREQVLHLLGRHPLLTVRQLADLLRTTRARIERWEREMIDLDWLRPVVPGELRGIALDHESLELARLGLVEVTSAGRRRLADLLGLDPATARRYHGLTGSGRADTMRRKRLLWALPHTVGANDVFVAFALAAAGVRRLGLTDELLEWRSAAACERRRCKPDGYGLHRREGVRYGFLLEYDRGTESAGKYAAKFRAYYRYRDSGQAARDYDGLPTILFVTTSAGAEDRIARQAYCAWYSRGTAPLPVLLTTTELISRHSRGVLGPIWRTPSEASGDVVQRGYWLPEAANQGRASRQDVPALASFTWTRVARRGLRQARHA